MTELVDKTQSLLHTLDDCVTVDDVISGGEVKITVDQYFDDVDCIINQIMLTLYQLLTSLLININCFC